MQIQAIAGKAMFHALCFQALKIREATSFEDQRDGFQRAALLESFPDSALRALDAESKHQILNLKQTSFIQNPYSEP